MGQQRGGAIVPEDWSTPTWCSRCLLSWGSRAAGGRVGCGFRSGPERDSGWAGIGITYGVVASVTGCIGAPLVIGIARRDRAALALVRAHRHELSRFPERSVITLSCEAFEP